MKNALLKVVLAAIILFIIINNLIFFPSNILCWDVFGYYLYLPLKFIYHDMAIHNVSIINSILEQYNSSSTFYQAFQLPDGTYVLKYTMGLSIIYSPFFFIGHIIAGLTDFAADGFSAPYQYSIFFGQIIYSILGIFILSRVLVRFFTKSITSIVLIIIVFSTNYIIHITMSGQNANSHNILFFAYALIIWLTMLWHDNMKIKYIILLGLVCGLTILIRPSEFVCLLIPLLWGVKNRETFMKKIRLLREKYSQLLLFVFILLTIGSFQFIYWKIHTGHFLFNSYGGNAGEGFEFFSPYIFKILFSFRKGWLIYTPVMIIAILGFIPMVKQKQIIFPALFTYFLLNLYVVSSWSAWWYSQSFSQRSMIPSYPVMAIALGYSLKWLFEQKKLIRFTGLAILTAMLFLNVFQTIQYANGTIHGDRMTREYYFAVFGKLKPADEDKKLLLVERSMETTESLSNEDEYNSSLLKVMDFEGVDTHDSIPAHSGFHSFQLDSINIYSPAIESAYDKITQKDHAWIKTKAYVYPTEDVIENPFSLVIHFSHKNYPYKYRTLDSEKLDLQLNKWNEITFYYLTPPVRRKSDKLKVYFWNRGKAQVFIDDFGVKILEKK